MIRQYKSKDFVSVLDFCSNNANVDFYITEDNMRIVVNDIPSLKKLIKTASKVFIDEERGDIIGVLVIWKSTGAVSRYYIKLLAQDNAIAKDLLTILLWNEKRDFYIKIKKTSPFLKTFTNKGFKFAGDRGKEILLNFNNKNRITHEQHTKQDSVLVR